MSGDEWGPDTPNGDLTPVLERSVELIRAARQRLVAAIRDELEMTPMEMVRATPPLGVLNLHDRCDACGAAAAYRMARTQDRPLDFCGHHWRKLNTTLYAAGWAVTATSPIDPMDGNT